MIIKDLSDFEQIKDEELILGGASGYGTATALIIGTSGLASTQVTIIKAGNILITQATSIAAGGSSAQSTAISVAKSG